MYNMPTPPDQHYQLAYRQAERRVKAKLGFYSHLASYVIVNGFLIAVYLLTGPLPGFYNYPWFVWVMFGWGIGLMFHYTGTFVFGNVSDEAGRRMLVEEEMRRMGYPGSPGYNYAQPQPPIMQTSHPFQAPPDKKD